MGYILVGFIGFMLGFIICLVAVMDMEEEYNRRIKTILERKK